MSEVTAIVLDQFGSEASRKICRLLNFFGVESQAFRVESQAFGMESQDSGGGQAFGVEKRVFGVESGVEKLDISERFRAEPRIGKYRVLGTVGAVLELAGGLEGDEGKRDDFISNCASVFCFIDGQGEALMELARKLGDVQFERRVPVKGRDHWKCSEALKDLTGPLAGLAVPVTGDEPVWVGRGTKIETIIGNESGAVFLKVDFYGVPLFLSTSEVIDLDAPLPARNFDVRPHFLSAVPAVLYIKSAFADRVWQRPEIGACMVVDDPLLRPRYGFLDYERMFGLMERLDFSLNVAFIPWNRNRSSRRTVELFQKHPERFSLSVHGCDHTGAEYGSRDRDWLAWKSHQSIERMAEHQRRTSLAFDPVMVFPQGVFSEAAMAVLKTGAFIGTVNSEVISADPEPRTITIADFWDVAVMNYSDFPIFTRRYPWAGMENFAFDILLGKPCLLNIHHNDCHDDYRCVTECVEQLNKLNAKLHWTNLGEVVRRGYRQRELVPGVMELEMYGNRVRVENPTGEKKRFRISKRESAPDTIREITVDDQPVKWSGDGKRVTFETELAAGGSRNVYVAYQKLPVNKSPQENLYYQARVMARRYLSECRDQFQMRRSFSE